MAFTEPIVAWQGSEHQLVLFDGQYSWQRYDPNNGWWACRETDVMRQLARRILAARNTTPHTAKFAHGRWGVYRGDEPVYVQGRWSRIDAEFAARVMDEAYRLGVESASTETDLETDRPVAGESREQIGFDDRLQKLESEARDLRNCVDKLLVEREAINESLHRLDAAYSAQIEINRKFRALEHCHDLEAGLNHFRYSKLEELSSVVRRLDSDVALVRDAVCPPQGPPVVQPDADVPTPATARDTEPPGFDAWWRSQLSGGCLVIDRLQAAADGINGLAVRNLCRLAWESAPGGYSVRAEERAAVLDALREVCGAFGDNDRYDNLHLADVIEKHLARHLYAAREERDAATAPDTTEYGLERS